MNREKYSGDYRLLDNVEDGRIKKKAEYIGEYYGFAAPAQTCKETAKLLLGVAVVMSLAFLLPLCMSNMLSRVAYVIIPHLCVAFPLFMLLKSLVQMLTVKEPFIHEVADIISQKYEQAAPIGVAIGAVAVAGGCVWMFFLATDTAGAGDVAFILCDLVMLAGFTYCFRYRHIAETHIIRQD